MGFTLRFNPPTRTFLLPKGSSLAWCRVLSGVRCVLQVVMSMGTHLYFDHPQEPDPEEIGLFWATRYADDRMVFDFMPDDLHSNAKYDYHWAPFSGDCLTTPNCPERFLRKIDFRLKNFFELIQRCRMKLTGNRRKKVFNRGGGVTFEQGGLDIIKFDTNSTDLYRTVPQCYTSCFIWVLQQ